MVASDYKHDRVQDPTSISDKQVKKVKIYVRDFLDKAVVKYQEHEKHRVSREAKHGSNKGESSNSGKPVASVETPGALNGDDDIVMSDIEDTQSSSPVKRKREEDDAMMATSLTPDDVPLIKRLKEESPEEPSPPPPPPPPMDAAMGDDGLTSSHVGSLGDDDRVLQESFSREQEEADRLADEAEQDRVRQEEALQRENEEAMWEFEMEQSHTTQHATGFKQAIPGQ